MLGAAFTIEGDGGGGPDDPLGCRGFCTSPCWWSTGGRLGPRARPGDGAGAALAFLRASAACFSCISSRRISSSSCCSSSCWRHSSSATLFLYLAYSLASASGSLWACFRASRSEFTCGAESSRFRFLLLGDKDPSTGGLSLDAASSFSSSCSRCRKSCSKDSGVKRATSYVGSCLIEVLLIRSLDSRGKAVASKASRPCLRIQVNNNNDSRGV